MDEGGNGAPQEGLDGNAPDENSTDEDRRLERGRLLFAQECVFLLGVAGLKQLPATHLPEVAFAGRSNVGKSSLINALTGRKTLARTSNTPGRTQQLNFFELAGRLIIVDLPGYGYAKAPLAQVRRWHGLIGDYLRGRAQLRRAFVLIDARHGFKAADREVMDMLDKTAVGYQVVLTKTDKITAQARATVGEAVKAELKGHVAAHPDLLFTSAHAGEGIASLRAEIAAIAGTGAGVPY